MVTTAIKKTFTPSLRVWALQTRRKLLLLCLKLLTAVCNSRYSGMMVLGESAQPWRRILWRCRAEQWLFRLLHSSRWRHICKGRGINPSFVTFSNYKVHINIIRDLIFQHFITFAILALLQNIYWKSKFQLCWSFEICIRNNLYRFIKTIIRIILLLNKSWTSEKQSITFLLAPWFTSMSFLPQHFIVRFTQFRGLSLTCWLYCGKQ